MAAGPVVEDLDVREHRGLRLGWARPIAAVNQLGLSMTSPPSRTTATDAALEPLTRRDRGASLGRPGARRRRRLWAWTTSGSHGWRTPTRVSA